MKYTYPAIIHSEKDGYWVEFPDLDGCFSDGDTEQETYTNAAEAMQAYLITLLNEKKDIPVPSSIKSIRTTKTKFSTFITCTIRDKEKSVKKTLTIPSWLNEKAEAADVNFSGLLQDAIKNKLGIA